MYPPCQRCSTLTIKRFKAHCYQVGVLHLYDNTCHVCVCLYIYKDLFLRKNNKINIHNQVIIRVRDYMKTEYTN